MKNLMLVYNIWKDLEKSFQESGFTDRLEYLKTYIDYKDGRDSIDHIIDVIQSDLDTYDIEEEKIYTEVMSKLNAAKTAFNASTFGDIDNLDTFLAGFTGSNAGSSKMNDLKMKDLEPDRPVIKEMTLGDIYDATGNVGNVTVIANQIGRAHV